MFLLKQEAFADNAHENIESFVSFWSGFYNETVGDINGTPIDYVEELNLNEDLTEENIRKLLRWKSPRHLTHINSRNEKNPKVQKTIEKIKIINSFRQQKITDDEFLNVAAGIFRNGFVYRAFLFHIARPVDYPIWDQHVARVHALLANRENTGDWQHYMDYRDWFANLKSTLKSDKGRNIKRLDDALMAYGQFLAKYANPK